MSDVRNYVDYKVTLWSRVYIEDSKNIPAIIEQFKGGHLPTNVTAELFAEDGCPEYNTLYDTEEYLAPSENKDDATVEIYEGEKQVWNNQIIK